MNAESKVYVLNLIAGSKACDGRCPFCVSKMTPERGMTTKLDEIDKERLRVAYGYAERGQAETIMITGKGEPTLFPQQITEYLEEIQRLEEETGYVIPHKEIQSNGIHIESNPELFAPILEYWRELGLETIAISVIHYLAEPNRENYVPYKENYIDLESLVEHLHEAGLKMRLACVMLKGQIDTPEKVQQLIDFAREKGIDELTIKPISMPDRSASQEIQDWTLDHVLSLDQQQDISDYLKSIGTVVKQYPWNCTVYDVDGQNVCLTSCLTQDAPDSHVNRALIFFPNGTIATGWTDEAEVLP